MRSILILLFITILNFYSYSNNRVSQNEWLQLTSTNIPDIPIQNGLFGAFIGLNNNVIIVAGGSYCSQYLNESKNEFFNDSIFVCIKNGENYQWKYAGKLPYPIAHGSAVATNKGLLCIGGENNKKKFNDVFLLSWNSEKQKVDINNNFPILPEASSHISASIINNTIYVIGGKIQINGTEVISNNFWKLNINDAAAIWQNLNFYPGENRFGASLVKQSNGENDCLFLFGGKSETEYIFDTYMYDPKKAGKSSQWKKLKNIPHSVLNAPALAIGGSQILIFSGYFEENNSNPLDIQNHNFFSKEILSYNTITNVWHKVGDLPWGVVNTTALMWEEQIIIAGGKFKPGDQTSKIITAFINPKNRKNFSSIDYYLLFIYLGLIAFLGYFFSSKNKSTKDFFLGGQKIPFWAAGLSMMAAQVSSIGFMSIPAKSFATNWSYFAGVFTWFIVVPIVIYAFVPFYRRLNVTSAYEYLEKRFNSFIRKFIAALYLLFQLTGRLGAIIFLPAIALSAVTGINAITCILIIGGLSTLYTVLGGMHAVIWIDVIQAIVLFGGIFLIIIYVFLNIDGGVTVFTNIAFNDNKFSLGSFDIDFTTAVFWVIFIGNLFQRLGTMSTDQSTVQRYLTTSNEKETNKALWTDAAVSIPWALAVFGLGTVLYVFYKINPELMDPTLTNDEIVPFFIGQILPPGISGIIIAAIFAASMSSVDSSIHSSTTVVMRDFINKWTKNKTELKKVSIARFITIIIGIMGTIIALIMTLYDINSVWDIVLEFASLFTGAMTGVFMLGIFSTRANGKGAIIGTLTSAAILLVIKKFTSLHFFLYSGIGIISCMLIGYIASFLFLSEKSTEGLTIYSISTKK